MRPARDSDRRGSIAILAALLLIALFAMVAFAVDTGYIVHARTRLQRAADAAALAAAANLSSQHDATVAARQAAVDNHEDVHNGLAVGDDDDSSRPDPIKVTPDGYWDRNTATFSSPPPYGRQPNAVRVTLMKSEATGNPLKLFFGRILGRSQAEVSASAIAICDRWLCGPFVGIDQLSVPGNPSTDSYSSEDGAYNALTAGDRGSICSDGPVSIDGTPYIRGDARAGRDYDVTMTGTPTITGSIGTRKKPLNLPPVDASEAAITNDNLQLPPIVQGHDWILVPDEYGDFLLDGTKVYDFPAGTFYFRNFTVTGQAVLNFDSFAPSIIYVTGNLERSGGTVVNTNTEVPSNLQILMTGGTAAVTSNNDFYGVIYAPNTAVTIDGDSDIYGAVVGKTLTITGTGSGHYDEALHIENVELPTRTALVD